MTKTGRYHSGHMKVSLEILKKVAKGGFHMAGTAVLGADALLSSLYFGKYGGMKHRRFYPSDLSKVLERLKRNGYVCLESTSHGQALRLTPAGQELLVRYEFKQTTVPRPRRWDRRWRVVIFDVHETRKYLRDRVREQLQRWGFYQLQKSVWVYPYDCEERIELLKTGHRVRHDLLYLTVIDMAQDNKLRKHFGLRLR